MNEIIVALITGGVTLVGVLLSNQKAQAVTETKIEELTRGVREHNNVARRAQFLCSRPSRVRSSSFVSVTAWHF